VLGDFTGRGNRGQCEPGKSLAGRIPVAVDVDNFWMLPGKLGAQIRIPAGAGGPSPVTVGFTDMDDFHPDRIFDRLELFQALKVLRKALRDPATSAQAAAEVRSWAAEGQAPATKAPDEPRKGQAKGGESTDDMLERLLGKRPTGRPAASAQVQAGVQGLIRQVVAPYIVPEADPRQVDLVAQVDRAISDQMRAVLWNSDFRALEAAWRGLHTLVSHVETDETLRICLIDVSGEELAGDLAGADVASAGMYRLLVEQSVGAPGGQPWALLVGCWEFNQQVQDVQLLGQLGRIAQAAGAPLLAGGGARLAGCRSFAATPDPSDWQWEGEAGAAEAFESLRGSGVAGYLGLVAPRFLLRLPYGKDGEPIDRFDFQELTDPLDHEGHLWGNGAFLCACLLGGAFRESGWPLSESLASEIGGLPMHVVGSGSRKKVIPCGEAYLTDRAMETLLARGLAPLLSVKGRDSVMLPRLMSIARPASPLEGRWR
jgi:type VI secretion system protein ImpC